jgi:NDP-sugar pyrophosphorylase family protein
VTEAPACIILAGGLGTRLHPLTESVPKALVPVLGEPFAHHQLSLLARQGVRQVVFCIGHLGAALREYVGDGARWGLSVRYVDEGDELRGTAGALRLAHDAGALDDHFAVLYGDSYLPIETAPVWDAFRNSSLPALMTVLRNQGRWDRSNAVVENRLVTLYDKEARLDTPGLDWIDYGLSVLERRIVAEHIPADEVVDLGRVYAELSAERALLAHEVHERFYEVGSPTGVVELERYLGEKPAEA